MGWAALYRRPLGKVAASSPASDPEWIFDPTISDAEKIKRCKEIISKNPRSEEAKTALGWLYSIIRADYVNNESGEKHLFFDYLQDVRNKAGEAETGKLALRYMIFWKMLENDDETAIGLSQEALEVMIGEDKKWVLVDLALTYAHRGQIQEARNVLQELREKHNLDEDLIAFIENDIAGVEEEIADGRWKPDKQAERLESEALAPKTAGLSQNYPNPFNPETVIKYQIPQPAHVTLKIYNLIGQHVRTLVDRVQEAGTYEIQWEGKDGRGRAVPSGVYLFRIQAGEYSQVRKMALLR